MVVLHICPLSDDPCNGIHVVVPQHVKAQRAYVDAALWSLAQPVRIDGLEQIYTADSLEELPAPYNRPDVAVFHDFYIMRYPALAKQLKRLGIPYIIMPHGALKAAAQQKSRLKKAAANLLLFRSFCNRSAGIQCLTEQEKAACVMGRKIFVAPNGINAPVQTKTAFHQGQTRFVYVGRILTYIKGLDLMLHAVSLEQEMFRQNGCTLDIYGPFEDRGYSYLPEMRELVAKNGVADLVTLHPAVVGEEKQRILLDADVFIQTSRTEGMPMGILEALSYGLPCLVTEGTTFAQTIAQHRAGWNGGSSAESIAAAMRRAAESRDSLSSVSQNALALSRQFGWDSAAKRAIACYRECASIPHEKGAVIP